MATISSPYVPTASTTPAFSSVASASPFRSAYSATDSPRRTWSLGSSTRRISASVSKCSVKPHAAQPHWWSPSHADAWLSSCRGQRKASVLPVFCARHPACRTACASTPRASSWFTPYPSAR